MVALARHLVRGMEEDTEVTPARRNELDRLADDIVERARRVDPSESAGVAEELRRFLDEWQQRGKTRYYWQDYEPDKSLLVSAEVVAEAVAVERRWTKPARATPNSMRDVEAAVQFRLTERLR